jgi:hypothetical protein
MLPVPLWHVSLRDTVWDVSVCSSPMALAGARATSLRTMRASSTRSLAVTAAPRASPAISIRGSRGLGIATDRRRGEAIQRRLSLLKDVREVVFPQVSGDDADGAASKPRRVGWDAVVSALRTPPSTGPATHSAPRSRARLSFMRGVRAVVHNEVLKIAADVDVEVDRDRDREAVLSTPTLVPRPPTTRQGLSSDSSMRNKRKLRAKGSGGLSPTQEEEADDDRPQTPAVVEGAHVPQTVDCGHCRMHLMRITAGMQCTCASVSLLCRIVRVADTCASSLSAVQPLRFDASLCWTWQAVTSCRWSGLSRRCCVSGLVYWE